MEEEEHPEVRLSERGTVRPLGVDEARALAPALAAMDPWLALGYSEAALEAYLTRPDPSLERHAVVDPEGLAGVACVRHPWLRGPYVELFAILPRAQGRGLGREVLAWLERDRRWAHGSLWLTVSDFNRRAQDFYRGLGYEEVARLSGLVSDGSAELLYRKRLGRGPEGNEDG